jgi:hypothetical protein
MGSVSCHPGKGAPAAWQDLLSGGCGRRLRGVGLEIAQ